MHEDIQRFTRSGLLIKDNASFVRLKEVHIEDLTDEMRGHGYMRVGDIDPQWSSMYDAEKDRYVCALTLYGVYVGPENCTLDKEYREGKQMKVR